MWYCGEATSSEIVVAALKCVSIKNIRNGPTDPRVNWDAFFSFVISYL